MGREFEVRAAHVCVISASCANDSTSCQGKNGADNARRIAALEVESAAKKESHAHIGFTL